MPDVGTFMKLCNSLKISPAEFGYTGAADSSDNQNAVGVAKVAVHFKGDRTPNEPTSRALANMILLASRMQGPREKLEDEPV